MTKEDQGNFDECSLLHFHSVNQVKSKLKEVKKIQSKCENSYNKKRMSSSISRKITCDRYFDYIYCEFKLRLCCCTFSLNPRIFILN